MKRVKIKILAEVETIIEIEDHEDITERFIDIYLHGEGENGCSNKIDLGSDKYEIKILSSENI